MADLNHIKSHPRPSPGTPVSQYATPQSNRPGLFSSPDEPRPLTSSQSSGVAMQRDPSKRAALAATAMQRTSSSTGDHGQGSTALKSSSGKTVPGMSSAGKVLLGEQLQHMGAASRPTTPGLYNFGSPGVAQSSPAQPSPAISSAGAGLSLHALAAEFGSPALGGLAGSVDMSLSLSNMGSNLGIGSPMMLMGGSVARAGGNIDDGERQRRIESILQTLGKRPGRISREGIERLARKCEMEIYRENEDKISLAGKNAVLVDIHYRPKNSPYAQHVGLTLATDVPAIGEQAISASTILLQDLSPLMNGVALSSKLDKFAANLERLAKMDKLSVPGANCFDAVHGVYSSLKRLYELERSLVRTLLKEDDCTSLQSLPSVEVMCSKSGRPVMNTGGTVGLSLEFWQNRRFVAGPPTRNLKRKAHQMDTNTEPDHREQEAGDVIHSLTIECEYCSAALYTPFRTTESWISDRIMKPLNPDVLPDSSEGPDGAKMQSSSEQPNIKDIGSRVQDATLSDSEQLPTNPGSPRTAARPTTTIEWLDSTPPLMLLPDPMSTQVNGSGDGSGTGKANGSTKSTASPHARFVAHFSPPMCVPYHIASQIYACVDMHIAQETLTTGTFDSLLLPRSTRVAGEPFPPDLPTSIYESHQYATRRVVPTSRDAEAEYDARLFVPRHEAAVLMNKLPFSHPRQLIAILPTLRQYALLSDLLRTTFGPSAGSNTSDKRTDSAIPSSSSPDARLEPTEEDLAALLDAGEMPAPRALDASLVLTPEPRLDVTFASAAGPRHVRVVVGLDGKLHVPGEDVFSGGEERTAEKRGRLADALAVCEDLAVWVAWIRRRIIGGCAGDGDAMHGVVQG